MAQAGYARLQRAGADVDEVLSSVLGKSAAEMDALEAAGKEHFVLLLTEIVPAKLALFDHEHVDAWVQIACPRLSVDWGAAFGRPLLSAYEFFVAVGRTEWKEQYPMDFYAKGSGPWTNYHEEAAGKAEKA